MQSGADGLRILMVNTGVFPCPTSSGGAENHVYYLSNKLTELGLEIDLVSDVDESAYFHRNMQIYEIGLPELPLYKKGLFGYALRHLLGGLLAFKKARELLKVNHYDVVHVHGKVAPFLLSLFASNIPLVFTLNDDPPSKKEPSYLIYRTSYRLLIETAAKKASHIVAVHARLKDKFVDLKISPKRISVIPNGVDVNLFKNDRKNSENSVIFVGSLTKRKGVDYLLEAVSKVDDVKIIIVGDGPEMDSLILQADNLDISGRVTFVGSVVPRELPAYYSSASIFVLPTLREALPLAVLEAMSCELPIIATNVSGMPTVIKDGYNGFLVEPTNAEELRGRIKFVADNPELCREMGENARKTVETEYSWDTIAEKTTELYMKLLRTDCKPTG